MARIICFLMAIALAVPAAAADLITGYPYRAEVGGVEYSVVFQPPTAGLVPSGLARIEWSQRSERPADGRSEVTYHRQDIVYYLYDDHPLLTVYFWFDGVPFEWAVASGVLIYLPPEPIIMANDFVPTTNTDSD